MSKKPPSSLDFFRKLYLPGLVRADNEQAKRITSALKARSTQHNASFNKLSPERRKEIARMGGLARQAKMTQDERLALARRAHTTYRKLPKELRTELSRIAGLAKWARMTEEERSVRKDALLKYLEKAKIKKMENAEPKWPFPSGRKPTGAQLTAIRLAKLKQVRFKAGQLRKEKLK